MVGRVTLSRDGGRLRALTLNSATSVRAYRAVLREGMGSTTLLWSWIFVASDVLGQCFLPMEVLSALKFGGATESQCSCQQSF